MIPGDTINVMVTMDNGARWIRAGRIIRIRGNELLCFCRVGEATLFYAKKDELI